MKCYLCNSEIYDWEEATQVKEGVVTLDAHQECQANANLEAELSNK